MFRVLTVIGTAAVSAFLSLQPAHALDVYFFRGAGDLSFIAKGFSFSRGLDDMAATLNREGIHSEVRAFQSVADAMDSIRERKPETIALVGHSMGALASLRVARSLRNSGIEIAYMGLIDIPGHFSSVSDNVAWVEDYHSDNPAFGRLRNAKSHPRARSIRISGKMHNRLDDVPALKEGILSAIRQVHQEEQLENAPPPMIGQAPIGVDPVTTAGVPVVAAPSALPAARPVTSSASAYQPATVQQQSAQAAASTSAPGLAPYSLPVAGVQPDASGMQNEQSNIQAQYSGVEVPIPPQGIDPIATGSVEQGYQDHQQAGQGVQTPPVVQQRGLRSRLGSFLNKFSGRRANTGTQQGYENR